MSEGKEAKGVPQLYPTEKVEESWWNMNVMPPAEYAALGEDMKAKGPYGIDPVIGARKSRLVERGVEVPEDVIVCVDGNHRLRKAKELKWKEIRLVIDEDMDEESARNISYAKNYERGHIDPFREAENFRWHKERGWTHERIAKEYRIDKSQVSKRLSLLNVEPEVVEQVAKVTRVKSASHLEPIATLKPELQREAVKEIKRRTEYRGRDLDPGQSVMTVKEVVNVVEGVKDEEEERDKLVRAIDKYQNKLCPECHGQPVSKTYQGLPWVSCPKGHEWNLRTGKTSKEEMEERMEGAGIQRERKPEKAPFPNYLRTTYTFEQFRAMLSNYAVSILREMGSIRDLDLRGTDKSGKDVELNYDVSSSGYVHLRHNDKSINVERKEYEKEDLKDFKTVVTTFPEITNKARAKEAKELVSGMMDEFGERPKRKRGPKPGRKRAKRRKTSKRSKTSKRGKRGR